MNSPRNRKPEIPKPAGPSLFGVYQAVVTDNIDPQNHGRVQVRVPAMGIAGNVIGMWANLSTLMAGNGYGTWFIPDVGNQVLVAFEGGDPSRPFILGALWSGQQITPVSMDPAGKNDLKVIHSRNGVRVVLDDTDGEETFTFETPGGQTITLKDVDRSIEINDSGGNQIKIEQGVISVTASAKVTINASVVEVTAGMLNVNSGLSRFSGILQADTVITNSVISSSYTPGAGNIW